MWSARQWRSLALALLGVPKRGRVDERRRGNTLLADAGPGCADEGLRERGLKRMCVLVTRVGVAGDGAVDDVTKGGREVWRRVLEWTACVHDDGDEHSLIGRVVEGERPAKHSVQENASRVDVGSAVDMFR